jgi:tripartite-type tricarboxylate transporter receptor subunit TctC
MELFKLMTKTDINQVEYRGTAPAMTDVVAGRIEIMITGPPSAKAMSEGGKLKLLAVTGKRRHPLMLDVPTIDESGVPGYDVTGWFGILAPAKTSKPVLDRLTDDVRKAVTDLRFRDRMTTQGLDVVGSTPEEMLALMRADTKKWAEVIKATGAKIQ